MNAKENEALINKENSRTRQAKHRIKELKEEEEKEVKNARKSPFREFYQFNKEYSGEMILLATKYPKAQGILLFLLYQMDRQNAIMCSHKVLCEALGIGRTTVTESIKVLKEFGFIDVVKSGTSNVYMINSNLAWNSWGSNHKYAKFNAKIVISASEQDAILKKKIKSINHKSIKLNNGVADV